MILYEKGTTNFTRNGLGYINDVLSAKIVEELNGEYSLTFEYPTNGIMSNELLEGRIVKCKVSDGTQQCFIIKTIVKTYEKMTITCSHIFYLLLDDFAENIYPYQLSPKPFLDWVLARANYQLPFNVTSDVSIQKTARYVRKNLVEVILGEQKNSMINLFGIEIKRNNFNIALNSRVGADRGEKLLYGKNITGINITTNANEIYTRIMPMGFDGLLLPEKYIDADNIDDYPYPKIGIFEFSDIRYDPEDETAYQTLEEAYEALREQVRLLYENGVNYPRINVKINWLELSKTEEYKQYSNLERVELGDTIHAVIFGLNYTTRVIKTTYNPLNDRVEEFEIGTLQANFVTQMNKYEIELENINPASILSEAQNNATQLITSAMGGYVYKTNEELYIMDNEDPNQAVRVWRWNINGLGYSNTGINGPYGLAMTMDGAIVADYITTGVLRTSVIEGYDSLTTQVRNNSGQISTLTQSVGELNSKIQDIADITTAAESEYAEVQLLNVNESQPIMIKIHPMNNVNISYLYPRANLYPSDTLYMTDRIIQFKNTSTNETFEYTLFDDLLYYDSTNYDEFYWDYDNNVVQITKRCEYDANGNVILKSQEEIETRTIPTPEDFYLTTGNYTITLPGYTNAYLSVRCMASNIYTSQFATHSELSQTANQIRTEVEGTYATQTETARIDSKITQTAVEITSEVSETYETKANANTNYSELDSKIDQTATSITSSVSQTYETKTNANTNYANLNSTITQKANEIYSSVAETYATQNTTNTLSSRISQTAKSIALSVNNGDTTSGITITTTKEDGTTATATGTIEMTGLVKFNDLKNSGSTQINGANITTGTISASRLSSSVITTSNFSSQNINASRITSGSLTSSNVKIGSWSINGTGIYSSNVQLYPNYLGYKADGQYVSASWLGVGRAGTAYSDKRLKKNIKGLDNKFNKFYDELKPISFNWKNIINNKTHIGFIAQDVQKAQKENELDLDFVYEDNNYLMLDKQEIIALNTWQIQLLKKQVQEQQNEINELKEQIAKLIERIDK